MRLGAIRLPAGTRYVPFDGLAERISAVQWLPGDDQVDVSQALSAITHAQELEQAVKSGTLPVKNPLTLAPHEYPVGAALQSAVVLVRDLRKYLAPRGILVEVDSEPGRITLEEAIQQLVRDAGEDHANIERKIIEAVQRGELKVYWPGQNADYQPTIIRPFLVEAYAVELNAWLERDCKRVTWRFPEPMPPGSDRQVVEAPPPRIPLMERNEQAVLVALRNAGFEPTGLPPLVPGNKPCPVKRQALKDSGLSKSSFDHAWKALMAERKINRR